MILSSRRIRILLICFSHFIVAMISSWFLLYEKPHRIHSLRKISYLEEQHLSQCLSKRRHRLNAQVMLNLEKPFDRNQFLIQLFQIANTVGIMHLNVKPEHEGRYLTLKATTFHVLANGSFHSVTRFVQSILILPYVVHLSYWSISKSDQLLKFQCVVQVYHV